jgi:outer membrane biosynthesis protein TonB
MAEKTSKIEAKLIEVTKVKSKSGEDRQNFFKRIISAVQELEEDVWESLDEVTQKWVNDGAKNGNEAKAIADFPDLKSVKEDAVKTDKAEKAAKSDKAADEKPTVKKKKEAAVDKKPAKKAEPAKKEKAEPAKKAKVKAKVTTRGSGLESQIKNLIIKKPMITADELVEKLTAKDVKASRFTVVAIRAGFRHSIKVLQEAGMIKGQIEL